jgi:hypothetical protein
MIYCGNSCDEFPRNYWFVRLPEIENLHDDVKNLLAQFMRYRKKKDSDASNAQTGFTERKFSRIRW